MLLIDRENELSGLYFGIKFYIRKVKKNILLLFDQIE